MACANALILVVVWASAMVWRPKVTTVRSTASPPLLEGGENGASCDVILSWGMCSSPLRTMLIQIKQYYAQWLICQLLNLRPSGKNWLDSWLVPSVVKPIFRRLNIQWRGSSIKWGHGVSWIACQWLEPEILWILNTYTHIMFVWLLILDFDTLISIKNSS